MEVETYRYLLSALTQVFGALIAVDAIFLILNYNDLKRKLTLISKKVGLHLAIINEKHTRITPETVNSFKDNSTHFELLEDEEISEKLRECEKYLEQAIINNENKVKEVKGQATEQHYQQKVGRLKYNLPIIKKDKFDFEKISKKVKLSPYRIAESMIIPALITISLAFFLLYTETFKKYDLLLKVGLFSILLVFLGFCSVVYYAIKAFQKNDLHKSP